MNIYNPKLVNVGDTVRYFYCGDWGMGKVTELCEGGFFAQCGPQLRKMLNYCLDSYYIHTKKKLAFWKKKLDDTIYKNGISASNNGANLTKVIDVLKEAKEDNCPINVDEFENGEDGNLGMNLLNAILFYTWFEHGEEDINNLEFLLLQSANWKTYNGRGLSEDILIEPH